MVTQVESARDARIGMPFSALDTPALLVDLDLMERNIQRIATTARAGGKNWRPHSKGLKTPAVARRCLAAGAIGMTCAKVGDAEYLLDNGIDHLVIANMVIGDAKLDRVARLCARGDVIISIDSREGLAMAAAAARRNGVEIGIVIEVDSGLHRCGTQPGEETLALAREVVTSAGVRFDGIMAWEGHTVGMAAGAAKDQEVRESVAREVATAELLRANGIPVRIVSASGTGTYPLVVTLPGVTEIQAGGGVYGDLTYARWGTPVDFALTILCTVTSRPNPQRINIDAGKKTFSTDLSLPELKDGPPVATSWFSAEHGTFELSRPSESPRIGDKVQLIAGYGDTTVFKHDELYGVRNGVIEEVWQVAPRSALR